MQSHAQYSPSRLSRIMKCPGSVKLIEDLIITETVPKEPKPNEYALHGTWLHSIMDKYYAFTGGNHNEKVLNGLETDDKYLVQECADYLDLLWSSKKVNPCILSSETKVDLVSWGLPNVWGTSDCFLLDRMTRHVDVIDWKFGSGITVYAKKNPQLLAYAAGRVKWPTLVETVTVHIVQPAIDHYDTWDLTISELYNWVHSELAVAIMRCEVDDPILEPGIEQCRWCEGKNHCQARTVLVQKQAAQLFAAQKTLASCPTHDELTKLLKMAPLVESAIKDIVSYVTNELEVGREFPGYKLVEGRANRKWIDELVTINWLSGNTEIEELFTSKLKSPSQIEKEARVLKKNENFKILYEKPPGKHTLVPESDSRPALQTSSGAINIFADISDID